MSRLILKKAVILILSFVYLTSTVGATVHLHYCMDKLVGWGLFSHEEEQGCSNCGMQKKEANKCCKDEHKQVKLKVDQKTPQAVKILLQPVSIAPFVLADFPQNDLLSSSKNLHPASHAPPFRDGVPVFLRNCVFLI